MSVSLGTAIAAGSWWHRLGELEGCVLDRLSYQGGAATTNGLAGGRLSNRLAAWFTDFSTTTNIADPADMTTLQQMVVAAQASPDTVVQTIAGVVTNMLIFMANADTPLPAQTLQAAFQVLINDMTAANISSNYSATVGDGTSSTWTTTVPSSFTSPVTFGGQTAAINTTPVGTCNFAFSAFDAAGRHLQYVYPETLTIAITQDAQNGAAAGQEPYSVVGQSAAPSFLSWQWLTAGFGSGSTTTGNLADPTVAGTAGATTGNLTVNGGMYTATTANICDNWTIVTGATIITQGTSTPTPYYTNGGWLAITSDGSTLVSLTQSFNVPSSITPGAGGSPYVLLPSSINNLQYAVFLAVQMGTSSTAAGVLAVELIDGSGNIINDDQGNVNRVYVDLASIADTNWHAVGFSATPYMGYTSSFGGDLSFPIIFRMPQALPAVGPYKLRLILTTAISSTKILYIGAVGMTPMIQLYPGGPYVAGWRGPVNPNSSGPFSDSWTDVVSYTPSKVQKAIWRYINPPALTPQTPGVIIPAVGTGTPNVILDSLVA